MYKQASKERLRIQTTKGLLSVEQLWDLSLEDLDALAVSLEQEYKNSKGKSFLASKTKKDKTIKLKFDVTLDILNTKVEMAEEAANAGKTKAMNEKILSIIQRKKDSQLEDMSIGELEKLLK